MIKLKNFKIFDIYVFSLVTLATIVAIIAFIVVWISPETLFKVINRVSTGQITLQQGLEWLFFEIPTILGKAIPVGLLLGTLVITDMLSRNFELVIFRSIGISFWRLARPILVLSSLCAVFCYFAYTTIIPYSSNRVKNIVAGNDSQVFQWTYLDRDEESNPKQLIIASTATNNKINGINVFQIKNPIENDVDIESASIKNIIFANNGEFKNNEFIIHNAQVYELLPNGIYNSITNKDKIIILSGKTAVNAKKLYDAYGLEPDNLTQRQLLEHLKLLKEEQIDDEYNAGLNNLYQRFAQTLSCIVFAICGLVLGCSRPRENRFLGFTIGAFIIFSYYLVIPFINMLAEKSILPPFVTAFLPVTVIAVAMYFYAKSKDL